MMAVVWSKRTDLWTPNTQYGGPNGSYATLPNWKNADVFVFVATMQNYASTTVSFFNGTTQTFYTGWNQLQPGQIDNNSATVTIGPNTAVLYYDSERPVKKDNSAVLDTNSTNSAVTQPIFSFFGIPIFGRSLDLSFASTSFCADCVAL